MKWKSGKSGGMVGESEGCWRGGVEWKNGERVRGVGEGGWSERMGRE